MGSDSYKFAIVILVALILLFCIWYFTSSRNNMIMNKMQENYENEDDEVEHMTNQVLNAQSGNTHVQADMPNPSEQELYRMAHAQDFPPETQTVQSNDPPLVGAGLQAEKSKNPAMQQLRQAGCFPKEMLTPEELKPQDNSTTWAQVNPSGEGSLKGRSFLQAGHNIGINTVGQTLRNANLQLRSEPPNPQLKVSPWNQTTIEPDVNRRPFEVGGCS
jgi:hypothetical protein